MPHLVLSIEDHLLYREEACYYKYIEYGIPYDFVELVCFYQFNINFVIPKQNEISLYLNHSILPANKFLSRVICYFIGFQHFLQLLT